MSAMMHDDDVAISLELNRFKTPVFESRHECVSLATCTEAVLATVCMHRTTTVSRED